MKKGFLLLPVALLMLAGCNSVSVSTSSSSSIAATTSAPATSSSAPATSTSSGIAPAIYKTSIGALNLKTEDDDTIVAVSGVVGGINNSTYGNFYLTDPVNFDQIYVYGLSDVASSMTATDTGTGYYTGAFVNDKSFAATGVAEGDYITMNAVFQSYNGTPEIMGYFVNKVAAADTTYTYDVTIDGSLGDEVGSVGAVDPDTNETVVYGTVVADPESGIAYGATVTLTVTPADGYSVSAVNVAHGLYGKTVLTAGEDGKYAFPADVINEVSVDFTKNVVVIGSTTTLTGAGLNLAASYADYTSIIDGTNWNADACYLGSGGIIQMRCKNGVASGIYNTSALPSGIVKLTFNYDSTKTTYNNSDILKIDFGTDSTVSSYSTTLSTVAGTYAYDIEPDAATYTYVKITVPSTYTYSMYYSSIVVSLAAVA